MVWSVLWCFVCVYPQHAVIEIHVYNIFFQTKKHEAEVQEYNSHCKAQQTEGPVGKISSFFILFGSSLVSFHILLLKILCVVFYILKFSIDYVCHKLSFTTIELLSNFMICLYIHQPVVPIWGLILKHRAVGTCDCQFSWNIYLSACFAIFNHLFLNLNGTVRIYKYLRITRNLCLEGKRLQARWFSWLRKCLSHKPCQIWEGWHRYF